jgi:hypothetical protein
MEKNALNGMRKGHETVKVFFLEKIKEFTTKDTKNTKFSMH